MIGHVQSRMGRRLRNLVTKHKGIIVKLVHNLSDVICTYTMYIGHFNIRNENSKKKCLKSASEVLLHPLSIYIS